MHFYDEVGCVIANSHILETIKTLKSANNSLMSSIRVMYPSEARRAFPYMTFHDDHVIMHEHQNAGYINPRKLVQAEQRAAELKVNTCTCLILYEYNKVLVLLYIVWVVSK